MSRIFSRSEDTELPKIDRKSVVDFFEARARKVETLGPTRAVIYQDKHPDLAERRDAAEKAFLLPKLGLTGSQRVLDLGCGTGRWTTAIAGDCLYYRGIDASPGLIEVAKRAFADRPEIVFSVLPVDDLSLENLGEALPFDVICCFGVLIYLNDEEVEKAFNRIAASASFTARIILREPIGDQQRLTIKEHFSEEMEQSYNAIYRTENELSAMIESHLSPSGFRIVGCGDVYADAELSNRTETKQRWFQIER